MESLILSKRSPLPKARSAAAGRCLPPHPGEVPRDLGLTPLRLTVTDAARALGVSRKTLSTILSGRSGISAEMAVRLSMAFPTTPESWLNQQLQYDLWQAEWNRRKLRVRRLSAS